VTGEWWFWAFAAGLLALSVALGRHYPRLVAAARRKAAGRGLLELPRGSAIGPGRGIDLSWLAFPVAIWIGASPWIWGYDDVRGAVAADVVTGGAILALGSAAVVFPALWALVPLGGLWLVTAPWLVGYGSEGGPVGLSDTIAGLLVCAASISGLTAAERRLRPSGGAGAIGRIATRDREH
jgi:hypothetical protein